MPTESHEEESAETTVLITKDDPWYMRAAFAFRRMGFWFWLGTLIMILVTWLTWGDGLELILK